MFDSFYNRCGEFEFIFHNETNLLLTVHGQKCYYAFLSQHRKPYMDNPYYRNLVEVELARVLKEAGNQNNLLNYRPVTITDMLNQFRDRLADFRCVDKTVYSLHLLDNFYDHIVQMVG